VYVLGERTYVTARPSLGETELEPDSAVQQLPRISCVSVFSKQHQQQQEPQKQEHHQRQPSAALAAVAAESVWQPPRCSTAPPAWLTSALAATLRQELGMCLFNFDLLIPAQTQQQQQHAQHAADEEDSAPPLCYVVDVNYFPGVDKIPQFESRFVEFLLAAAAGGTGSSTAAGAAATQQQQGQLAAVAAAAGAGEQQQAPAAEPPKRPSSSSGGSSSGRRLSSSSGCGGLEGATAAAGQWDASKQQGLPMGSSPPLQVAGCS
jgi:inositol-1,3,4-trisphosphate 5/6-kinase/inositol-tetrakisphosphate 1-kinase